MSSTVRAPVLTTLFSPIRLNTVELPNRILMSSMHLNLDGFPDQYERMATFYALRARGGAGLIITAGCGPNAEGKATADGFSLESDEQIAGHAAIVDAVHREGGRIALQILHFGREAFHGRAVSSSAHRLPSSFFTPTVLDEEGIARTIASFAECAGRALQANYDAIELIFSQGFLVHQFLAPLCNDRQDRWGGCFDNRARLAVAIASAVRARVGPDVPVIFRLPCLDLIEGGLSREESIALVHALVPFGIDLLNVSIGWHESSTPTIAMDVPRAAFADLAAAMRERFPDLKVAASNRINDPRLGERLLREGCADVIAMGRPFLADPFIVEKARRNAFEEINTCIACNQRCLDYVFVGKPVGCSVAPDSVQPTEGVFAPFSREVRVAVVGGGIAGLGAAVFLRRRGAYVTLFEATPRLGGQLRLAERIPGKTEFSETIRYYTNEVYRLGIDVRLNTPFDDGRVSHAPWDFIVFAHGSEPRVLEDLSRAPIAVVSYVDVIDRGYPIIFPVVIVGGGGVACDVAKFANKTAEQFERERASFLERATRMDGMCSPARRPAAGAPAITLLQRSSRKIAHRIGRTTRWILMKTLDEMGVAMRTAVDIVSVDAQGVHIVDRATGVCEQLPARTIIVAAGQTPRVLPVHATALAAIPYRVIGAAASDQAAANLSSALAEAYDLALEIA